MLNEAEKRAALLAVSRYGVDQKTLAKFVQSFLRRRQAGSSVDLVDALLSERLLTTPQVRELKIGLEKTRVDEALEDMEEPDSSLDEALAATGIDTPNPDEGLQDLRSIGDIRILRRLGIGGMGAVFLGYEESKNRHVAVKVLSQQLAKSAPLLTRFLREANSLAHLNHPNIVRCFGVGEDAPSGLHYLILEYVEGPSALEELDRQGKFSVADGVHIVLDVARALEHAHSRNIIHRDIKPSNILLTQTGLAKLIDLGLTKRTDQASSLTLTRQGFGTPYYMPYEQALNAKSADGRSDIYALGATLYHLIVGDVPFQGANALQIVDKKAIGDYTPASQVNSDIPQAIDQIIAKMLAREPQDRYQTASELIVALERTGLATSLPSFANRDLAMRDPIVQQRLAVSAQTTRPELHIEKPVKREEPQERTSEPVVVDTKTSGWLVAGIGGGVVVIVVVAWLLLR